MILLMADVAFGRHSEWTEDEKIYGRCYREIKLDSDVRDDESNGRSLKFRRPTRDGDGWVVS